MSANGNGDEIPGREIAYRVFAAEYDDADLSYAESDEERAPNYVITPTGARLNRVFAVGTLTEVTSVNDEMLRARVVDPTGAFVVYAGQYQPDELAALEQLEPPAFVAVTGKARTFQPEDSDQVYTSIRPESIATVDAATRDRWVVTAAEQTVARIGTYAAAADLDASGDALTQVLEDHGVEKGLAAGVPIARDHYDTTADYLATLRDRARQAVEVVADEREQVSPLQIGPRESSPDVEAALTDLADLDLSADAIEADAATPDSERAPAADETSEPATSGADETADDLGTGSAAGTATARSDTGSATDSIEAGADTETDDIEAVESETDEVAATAAAAGSAADTEREMDADASAESAAVEPDDGADDLGDGADSPDEAASDLDDGADDLGDFDAGGSTPADAPDPDTGEVEADAEPDDDLGDFDAGDGMYEMDDEEREQIEAEFGTEFTTGTEVDEPGENEIDVPAADEASDAESEPATDPDVGDSIEADEPEAVDEGAEEPTPEEPAEAGDAAAAEEPDAEAEGDDEPPEDVDLQEYVVDTMAELDDGDGADRTELVETVADETGTDESEVEDAIQDALMGGQCYEPDDETLKPI